MSAQCCRHTAPAGQGASAHARLRQADARLRGRVELLAFSQDYAGGRLPLVVTLTLFGHHIRRCGVLDLAERVYLPPHPVGLRVRNQCDAMKKKVVVDDRMQQGYVYWRTEPAGRNFAPAFRPELTPKQMLKLGVFGGKYMTDCRSEFPAAWFAGAKLCAERHDPRLNCFGVNASQSLAAWRRSGWIHKQDPRGWFQWYCRYYMGRRSGDDARQIRRWRAIARHVAAIRKNCEPGDRSCRMKQRQAVLHWAYDSRWI